MKIFKSIPLILGLLFVHSNLYSQNINVENMIWEDHIQTENMFRKHIFIESELGLDQIQFSVVSQDTLLIYLEDHRIPVLIIKTGIKMRFPQSIYNIPIQNEKPFSESILYYYVITSFNSVSYKLFGFYSSDIQLFVYDYGVKRFESLVSYLHKNKILTRKESRLYRKAVIKKKFSFSTGINKPCELLKYFFDDQERFRANSIILPLQPLKPFSSS